MDKKIVLATQLINNKGIEAYRQVDVVVLTVQWKIVKILSSLLVKKFFDLYLLTSALETVFRTGAGLITCSSPSLRNFTVRNWNSYVRKSHITRVTSVKWRCWSICNCKSSRLILSQFVSTSFSTKCLQTTIKECGFLKRHIHFFIIIIISTRCHADVFFGDSLNLDRLYGFRGS